MIEQKNEWLKSRVVVIGAGIAGLSAAYYLRKRGIDVTLLERENFVGGSVRSVLKEEKYIIELGPNAFLASSEPIQKLARELSLEPLIVGSEEVSKKRFIFKKGKMHDVPTGPSAFLKSGLISFTGKLRLMCEPFIRSRTKEQETVADFVKRRGGREVLDTLVDPFVTGVWAGDPSELEMESVFPEAVNAEAQYGSVMKGMKKLARDAKKRGLYSFRWGMGTLTARLEEVLRGRIRTGVNVEKISRREDGTYKIKLIGEALPMEADAVVVAAPAYAAAKLLMAMDQDLFKLLSSIQYAPLAVVHTVFNSADIPQKLDGFGVLIPRKEDIRLLGSIWSSSLFPMRTPAGEFMLTSFIGGALDREVLNLSDDELLSEVKKGIETVMGIKTSPRFTFVKRWNESIAQYTIGHAAKISKIDEETSKLKGVFLTGSYFNGISVSDTIEHARSSIERVTSYLKTTSMKKRSA